MPNTITTYMILSDPEIKKMVDEIRIKILAGQVLDIEELLLVHDYYPHLYEEYRRRVK